MRALAVLLIGCFACTDPLAGAPDGGAGPFGSTDCHACDTAPAREVEGCEVVGESFPCEGKCHVEDDAEVTWQHNPPHSGDHSVVWERDWGEHSDPAPRNRWVHNLEHGGIALLYDCPEPCEAEVDVLRDVIEMRPEERILLTPDPLLASTRFAALSWTWALEVDTLDVTQLLCFVDEHEGQAPEDVW